MIVKFIIYLVLPILRPVLRMEMLHNKIRALAKNTKISWDDNFAEVLIRIMKLI